MNLNEFVSKLDGSVFKRIPFEGGEVYKYAM